MSRPASTVRPQWGQGHRMGALAGHQLLCFRSSAREGGNPCEQPPEITPVLPDSNAWQGVVAKRHSWEGQGVQGEGR